MSRQVCVNTNLKLVAIGIPVARPPLAQIAACAIDALGSYLRVMVSSGKTRNWDHNPVVALNPVNTCTVVT